MIERIQEEIQKELQKRDELVASYESKKAEMLELEKQIIRNQGAIEALDALGFGIQQEAQAPKMEAEVVEG